MTVKKPTASAVPPDFIARPCPICGKPSTIESRPFCTPRCRTIDLGKWLTGAYAIPVVEEDGAEDDDGA